MILDWHCGYSGKYEIKAKANLEARGGEVFIAYGKTKARRRRGKTIPPKKYNIYGAGILFWRGTYGTKEDGLSHILTNQTLIKDAEICRIAKDCASGKYDDSKNHFEELKAMIGKAITYDNPIHPYHGKEVMITELSEGGLIGEIEVMGKAHKFNM